MQTPASPRGGFPRFFCESMFFFRHTLYCSRFRTKRFFPGGSVPIAALKTAAPMRFAQMAAKNGIPLRSRRYPPCSRPRPIVCQADKSSIEEKSASLLGPDDRHSPLAGKLEMLGKVVFILFCLLAGVVLVLATGTLEGGLGAYMGPALLIGYVLFWGTLFKFPPSAAAVLVEASYRSKMAVRLSGRERRIP